MPKSKTKKKVRILSWNSQGMSTTKAAAFIRCMVGNGVDVGLIQESEVGSRDLIEAAKSAGYVVIFEGEAPTRAERTVTFPNGESAVIDLSSSVSRSYAVVAKRGVARIGPRLDYARTPLIRQKLGIDAATTRAPGKRQSYKRPSLQSLKALGHRRPVKVNIAVKNQAPLGLYVFHAAQGSGSSPLGSGMDAVPSNEMFLNGVGGAFPPRTILAGDLNLTTAGVASVYPGLPAVHGADRLSHIVHSADITATNPGIDLSSLSSDHSALMVDAEF
jgi:hypothetical protein